MKQGLICLIPKPNKDSNCLDNWRPITLLNSDYKILASVYADKLKPCLANIISNTQSGFLKGRHISNNIRLILDILDYSDLINKEALILFIDFYKAFDSVEHLFIFEALSKFGFGKSFINAIHTLYNGINSCVSLASGTSPRFSVGRGIRQGCPISPFLFLLSAELLSLHIKHSNIKGINIGENTLIISQLADDTCLFLKNDSQVAVALNEFNLFSKASGLVVNSNKSEILYVHDSNKNSVNGIKVKRHVKYLGVDISRSDSDHLHHNFQPRLDYIKNFLCCWLQRDLTIYGRVLLTKAEGISRLVYPAFSLYVDQKTIKSINSLLFRFIWKNKTEYIQRKVIIRNYKEGGLNAIDFEAINQTFKINWIKYCLSNNDLPWFWIPNLIFKCCGGLKFILSCNFKCSKLPIKLSNFHKQALESWKIAFKHNFSPHTCIIWNNENILSGNKSLFLIEWVNQNIFFVSDLFNAYGDLLSFPDFVSLKGATISVKDLNKVIKSIPVSLKTLFKAHLCYGCINNHFPILAFNGVHVLDKKCNNFYQKCSFFNSRMSLKSTI
ncbi:hypothetical protein H4Q32_000737 [Labeo rohita]|uniref:Reverse transcriptase domain-containing protein n=1 Tax=Labeo rohita TaxID=84645 RepID=A0ABQ8LJ46_LABRO|nr:hypothetical protein H4Q32_000737 [Labeo rohita]